MTNEELLEQLFPLPEGFKLRKPRFGTAGPTSPTPIPDLQGQRADTDSPRPPFEMHWKDQGLGLAVDFCENSDGDFIAYVTCDDAECLNKAVSVALHGSKEDALLRKTIPLTCREKQGCSGAVSFGPLQTIKDQLGGELRLSAYLLE